MDCIRKGVGKRFSYYSYPWRLALEIYSPFVQNAKAYALEIRKVVEHVVLFQLQRDVSDKIKQEIAAGLYALKDSCSQWVKATSAGYVLHPDLAKGATIGLSMRFFSKEALDKYFDSEPKTILAYKFIIPYMTGEITIDYEAEVNDDDDSVYRQGEAFKSGVERIVGIKLKDGTRQEAIDTMVKSLNDLNDAPELSSLLVQITAGSNFCVRDKRYTHGLLARCRSVEALDKYWTHPYHTGVVSKTVWPIAAATITADFVVDHAGVRRALM